MDHITPGGLRMSGDGSKFFCIIGHGDEIIEYCSLQAWSIQTGEVVSNVTAGIGMFSRVEYAGKMS